MSIEGNAAIPKAGAAMKADEPAAPERIGETFRNGRIIGVTGFAIDIAPLSEGL